MGKPKYQLVWRQIHWSRPLEGAAALGVLERIATEHALGTVVVETRSDRTGIRFLVATASPQIGTLTRLVTSLVPGTTLTKPAAPRGRVTQAPAVKVSHRSLALTTDRLEAITRAVLASLAATHRDGDELVLQVVLGGRLAPAIVEASATDPRRSLWHLLTSGTAPASTEVRSSMKTHASRHGFKTAVAIGVRASDAGRERSLAQGLFSALRVAETAGISLHTMADKPERLNAGKPPARYGLRLPVTELVGLLGWPIGEDPLPGVAAAHPVKLAPKRTLARTERVFARLDVPGRDDPVGIPIRDASRHTIITGYTGAGKTNVMATLAAADIQAGRGCLVIDPKNDIVRKLMTLIPAHRKGDVVIIDPTDARPVGFNPLADATRDPELVADTLLATFKSLFADSWGVRLEETMTAALLDLARTPGSTLAWLPRLLTDPVLRRTIISRIDDRLGTGAFWAKYEAMKPAAQATLIGPALNRLQALLIRPALRRTLGQARPAFQLDQLFSHRRIVLVALNKGILGESARLLGALLVSQLWHLILRRALVPESRRTLTPVYIDELHDFVALPDLEAATVQARSLGVPLVLGHQHRSQLSASMLATLDSNAMNKIHFGMSAKDAADVARGTSQLVPEDLTNPPRFGVYTNLQQDGHATGWMSATTMPAPAAISDPAEIKAASMTRYGIDADQIDAAIETELGLRDTRSEPDHDDEPVGRRRT